MTKRQQKSIRMELLVQSKYKIKSADSDNETYNENNDQQQLPEGFANSCYKIVSPILPPELISNFAVCKGCSCYCSGPLLLAVNLSHGFVGLELHISKSNHSFY